jgi:hypothetical protein
MAFSKRTGAKNKSEARVAETKNKKWLSGERWEEQLRELPLVAQEIKTKQKPHYDDDEEQGESDNVTDIHY